MSNPLYKSYKNSFINIKKEKMTLTTAVSNILLKEVTEEEAKNFALEEYGVLCAYIRYEATQQHNIRRITDEVNEKYKNSKKHMTIQLQEEYETWLKNCENSNSVAINHVNIQYEPKSTLKKRKTKILTSFMIENIS